ncbi:MAG TPA: folate-binding protein [Noviherbaspirillum sp.]|nr:folate-binding protein [Noviherbaspirillum sp.]
MTEMTSAWLQFLAQQGAHIAPATQRISGFPQTRTHEQIEQGFVAPLTDLGLIAVSGDDGAHFLHNQLTNDVEHLGAVEARLAGYCSPKGRLLATFLMWKAGDAIMLQLPREIQPGVQKRLQMYVLRAKAKLLDATGEYAVLGIGGRDGGTTLQKWFSRLPEAPFTKVDGDAGMLIRVADAGGSPRYQWIAPSTTAQQAWKELSAALTAAPTATWHLGDIHAGIPQVTQATQEQFVPQMINFELIGGVNFKKGCYPGQEIVARSQYLGKLKRRMILAGVDAPQVAAGMEIYSAADPEQPCGMVVNAERNTLGGFDCLVELKTAALDDGAIHLGSAGGPALALRSLPYALPDTSA